jgi:hypothetical protein
VAFPPRTNRQTSGAFCHTQPKTLSQLTVPRVRDDIEIVEEDVMFSGNYEAYLDNSAMDHASPEYNMELGLAMMPLPNTYTVERLWHGNA